MKIIIVAPHASAKFGGESILPLHYFSRLRSRGQDVLLVVHERTKEELSNLFGADCPQIFYVPDRWYHKLLHKCGKLLPDRIGSMSFGVLLGLVTQLQQKKVVKKIIANRGADVIHEPIRVSPASPSMMYGFGVPVIIGPMNGGMTFPECFPSFQSSFEKYYFRIGRLFSGVINRLLPGKALADTLLVANRRTAQALPVAHPNIIELVENGVDLSLFSPMETVSTDTFNLLYLGRLVDWKAIDILLDAMAKLEHPNIILNIVGDGDQRQYLENYAAQSGLGSRVVFHGFKPQTECAQLVANSNCLVLPSLYECGGAVVLEAMAMCKPVIASDWGGPADYLDADCGILIDVNHGREAMVNAFTGAIEYLYKNPEEAKALGVAGRKKVEENFDWDKKISLILEVYKKAIERKTS